MQKIRINILYVFFYLIWLNIAPWAQADSISSSDADLINVDSAKKEYEPVLKITLEYPYRYREPHDTIYVPLSLTHPNPMYLKNNFKGLETMTNIDFIGRRVELSTTMGGVELWSHYYLELDEYIRYSNNRLISDIWYAQNELVIPESEKIKKYGWLDIEIPMKLPAWARRIVGEGGPRLTITGEIKFILGVTNNWQANATDIRGSNDKIPTISADSEMRFSIRGRIGRLIDVEINQDNKGGNIGESIKQQLKIHYKGEGDELEDNILQEIEAGNTQLALPNTEFSGYSETHKGLFGIRGRWKIGDIDITGVASIEEGSAQTKSVNPSGTPSVTSLRELDIREFTYFFLDTIFISYKNSGEINHGFTFQNVKVFRSEMNPNKNIRAGTNIKQVEFNDPEDNTKKSITMKLLTEGIDYTFHPSYGYIAMNEALRIDEYLAVSYTMLGNGKDTTVSEANPKLLKSEHTVNSDKKLWRYAWRNVYEIGSVEAASRNSAKVRIFLTNTGSTDQEQYNGKKYVTIFGIADENGEIKRDNPEIFDWDRGVLIFPETEPFANESKLGSENINQGIYQMKYEQFNNKSIIGKYKIEITSKSKRSTVHLDMNILPKTEKVTLGGRILAKDKDYIIDYEMGTLTFIAPEVLQSNEEIKINYEYAPFFIPEQKVFLGSRLEWKLPYIGSEAFVGASVLHKRETAASQQRAQIGKEPNSNTLLDLNTKLAGSPDWMTDLVNKIPLVSTSGKSHLSLSAEIAHSIVNPNTRGEAVIDDFEGAEQTVSIPIGTLSWHIASPPVLGDVLGVSQEYLSPLQLWGASNFFWCNTVVNTKDIWPGMDIQVSNNTTTVLNLASTPYAQLPDTAKKYCWSGVMYPMISGMGDQIQLCKFIEVWVNSNNSNVTLNFDLGIISEDLRLDDGITNSDPNKASPFLDRELLPDENGNISEQLDKNSDVGIDHTPDKREKRLVPTALVSVTDTLKDSSIFFGDSASAAKYGIDSMNYDSASVLAQRITVYVGLDSLGAIVDTFVSSAQAASDPRVSSTIPLSAWCIVVKKVAFNIPMDTITIENMSDPAGDNYAYSSNDPNSPNVMDYKNYMGTEHNTIPENQGDRTRGGHVQDEDTEDINRSLSLDRANRYFHYSVNLSGEDIDRYRVNKQDNTRWYYLRIPLSEYKGKINDPDLSAINTFRVYVNNIGGDYGYPTIVQLAKIEITGNKWQESVRMIKNPADTSRMIPDTTKGKIEVSVINTDNSEEYKANRPNFVPVLYNTTNNTQQREQALQIKYTNVIKDSSLLVFKNFSFQQIDLSTYRVLRIYVRGMDMSHDSVYYFLRFGRDSANYYECSRRLKDQRWDSLTIEMNEITAVKKAYLDNHKFDTSARVDTSTLLNAGNPAEQCSLKIKGTQSYTNVLWVALGVKNLSNSPASGEFWVNDLKVVDIKKQKGWASRITFESRFADFLQLNSDLRYQDGGFLMLTERSKGSQGASSLTSNLSAILHANKFTPASWGLVTPLTVNLSNQVTRPKYAPSSDIELVAPGNEHDGFREIAPRLFNDMMRREIMYVPLTMASEYEGRLATRGFSTSYKKSSPSQNIFTNLIADRTTTSYNYSNRFEKQSITGSLDTSYSHQNSLDYDLSPKTQKIVSPFSKSKYNSLQGMRVHWLWDTWNMNIYDASYMRKIEIIPPGAHKTNTDTTITRTRSFLLSHSTNLNWNFLQWDKLTLSTDYNLSMYRDFYKWINSSEKGFFDFAASNVPYMTENPYFNHLGIFKGENSRKQDISYNLDSRLINMLPLTLSYSSSYNQEIKEQVISSKMSEYMKMSLGNTFTARTQLGLDPILESGEKISNLLRLNLVARVFSQAKKFVNSISFSGVSFSYSTLSNYDINGIRRLDFDSKMNSKFGFYTFQLGLKRGFYDIFSSNTGDTKRFGEFDYPYYSDSTYFVKALSDNNSRKASRNYDVSSSMTLFKKLNLSGSIAYDISWSELAKERHYDFHDTLFARSGDSSVFHMGDTTISFPDISYNARINQFLNFWKYVPMIGPSSKSAEISHSGNYKRSSTRPFDVFKYDGHYGINSSVRWRSKKDWEWVLTDKRDWNKTYDLLQTKFDYKCSWSDSLGFKRSLGAKRAFKILRWTLQFENQLDVFGGVGYGRSYDKGTTIDTTKLSSDQTREIRLDVEGYGEIKRLFKSIKDLKPTREKSNISISSGFAYNFSKNINGGGHITYQRKKEGEMPSNTVDIKVFVLIKL